MRVLVAIYLVVCPLAALGQGHAPAAHAVRLRYKFAPGQTQRYHLIIETHSTRQPLIVKTEITLRQTVKSVRKADGAATCTGLIETLHLFSDSREVTKFQNPFAAMQQPYTLVTLPNGKVLSFRGVGFSSSALPGSAVTLPNGPVKVGETWAETAVSASAGTRVTLIYTLLGLVASDGITRATIAQKTRGTLEKTVSQGVQTSMRLSGQITGEGVYVFDVGAGAINHLNSATDTAITLTFGKSQAGASAHKLPKMLQMHMQQKITLNRLADAVPASAASAAGSQLPVSPTK